MKAALLEKLGTLSVMEMETPKCAEGEVLIKVEACGICRTDMKCFSYGQRDLKLPRILGHEIAGTVADTGPGVTGISIGERVQIAPGLPCGKCDFCKRGWDHLCSSVQIMGFHYHGGFAEYVLVPAHGVKNGVLNPIPEGLSCTEAALTEPLACCVNMQESLDTGPGDVMLIFGAGPLGILNAKLARLRGVKQIILIEPNEDRRRKAKDREFDYCLNAYHTEEIRLFTQEKEINVIIPCCPGMEPFGQAINLLGKRGRLGFFSGLMGDHQGQADINLIHYKELSVCGAYGCSSGHNRTALSYLAEGKVKVKDMITRRIGLDEVMSGLEMVRKMSETSIVIEY
ncbi:zinc-dependent dehydrogenase [Candidatus Formimonas warabiya]|nr:zinc-dependent dehydrogenase [Candidatus Formimonas warabiya]